MFFGFNRMQSLANSLSPLNFEIKPTNSVCARFVCVCIFWTWFSRTFVDIVQCAAYIDHRPTAYREYKDFQLSRKGEKENGLNLK